ncbi:MAG TPA: hypothetical protein VFZ22_00010 [Pyrinomonadaceae bacterium]|nr:hypothetical protein [Pyrinomonadaceae bacterium]
MTKITIIVAIFAATLFFCRGSGLRPTPPLETVEIVPESPSRMEDSGWEQTFFKALEERTKKVNLASLSDIVLGAGDLEARFWYDARPDIINGFVIRRSGTRWSALGIRQVNDRWPSKVTIVDLGQPESGWESLWKRLIESQLLTLPDGDQTKCHSEILDGAGFVVETSVAGEYRTYRYANPQSAVCDEAKRVLSIESIIAAEFRLLSQK